MFSGGYVVSILVDGKTVQHSKQGIIPIHFGSEYVIRLRNRTDRDAVAVVTIDGENVSEGGFIVRAKQKVDIERPVNANCKFKFVSSDSSEAQDAGKDNQPDDRNGVIEVKWRGQRPKPPYQPPVFIPYTKPTPWQWPASPYGGYTFGSTSFIGSLSCLPQNSGGQCSAMRGAGAAPKLEEGCTVEGSYSGQNFYHDSVYDLVPENEAVVIKLVLKGYKGRTMDEFREWMESKKPFCGHCGHRGETTHKFCTNCGKKL